MCVCMMPSYLSVLWGCCRVNIGQSSSLLFAFDCWVKCVSSPCYLLMITPSPKATLYPKPNIRQRNHHLINFNFLCSRLNNFISARHASRHHHPVVCLVTACWEEGGGGACSEGFISWIWCECKINWNWYRTTFKICCFWLFKGKFLHMKCIWNEDNFLPNFRELFTVIVQREYFTNFHQKRAWINQQHSLSFFVYPLDSSSLVCNQ